jgi:hypothetical protein
MLIGGVGRDIASGSNRTYVNITGCFDPTKSQTTEASLSTTDGTPWALRVRALKDCAAYRSQIAVSSQCLEYGEIPLSIIG